MGYLIVAGLFIVLGSFSLVYGFDKKCSVKTRRSLLIIALICYLIVGGLAAIIMKNPLR